MIYHLAQISAEQGGGDCFVFANAQAHDAYRFPGVRLIDSGKGSDRLAGRLLAQQVHLPRMARQLGLSCLFCPGNVISVLSGIPTVLVIQDRLRFDLPASYGLARRWYRQILSRLSVQRAKRVVAVSHDLARYLVTTVGVPAEKVTVVYEGVDWQQSRNKDAEPSPLGFPYVLNVSSLLEHKNQERLIQAFAMLHGQESLRGHKLVIVGADPLGRKQGLQRLAADLEVADAVEFLGFVPREQLPRFYQHASVFVYPSLVESFGLPILEAMAQGVPVVTSDRTALPEIAGDAALIALAEDPDALAAAIQLLLQNAELRNNYIERGYRRAAQFCWQDAAKKMYEILAEVSAPIQV